MTYFTKSNMMSFYRCPKKFWLEKHSPELSQGEPDRMIIANGVAVGAAARDMFPDGIYIETLNLDKALDITREQLKKDVPLFEPAFEYDGVRVRVDILHEGTLTEVKSGSNSKGHYITDAAIQAWVVQNAGITIDKVCLALINTEFVYQGNGYDDLLKFEDITEQVRGLFQYMPTLVEKAKKAVEGKEPLILTGPQCKKPHVCPFQEYCNAERPEYLVESLPRSAKIVDALKQEGIDAIEDIPEGWLTNETQQRVHRAVQAGQAEIDPELLTLINELPYPRYYLDFESIAFAIPIWAGTRPFQHLPFQWSCHIEPASGEMGHKEFLDLSGEPPMRAFAESLIEEMDAAGPIIVYSHYEKGVLTALQKMYPDLAEELGKLIDRLVDLLPLMRKHYYHPDQHGSWSIKALLPVVAPDLNYKDLNNVHNGTEAQMAFMEAIASTIDAESKKKLEQDMLEYCKLDTLAMVKVVEYLKETSL